MVQPKIKPYFAYGSNMSEQQMRERCPQATLEGKAWLSDYSFRINKRGVATIIPSPGATVFGLLWLITSPCEDSLDRHEGVKNNHYTKASVQVICKDGSQHQALVYVATIDSVGAPRSGYLEKIIPAAEEYKFPDDYLDELRSWATP